jgi:hypothetical protein
MKQTFSMGVIKAMDKKAARGGKDTNSAQKAQRKNEYDP